MPQSNWLATGSGLRASLGSENRRSTTPTTGRLSTRTTGTQACSTRAMQTPSPKKWSRLQTVTSPMSSLSPTTTGFAAGLQVSASGSSRTVRSPKRSRPTTTLWSRWTATPFWTKRITPIESTKQRSKTSVMPHGGLSTNTNCLMVGRARSSRGSGTIARAPSRTVTIEAVTPKRETYGQRSTPWDMSGSRTDLADTTGVGVKNTHPNGVQDDRHHRPARRRDDPGCSGLLLLGVGGRTRRVGLFVLPWNRDHQGLPEAGSRHTARADPTLRHQAGTSVGTGRRCDVLLHGDHRGRVGGCPVLRPHGLSWSRHRSRRRLRRQYRHRQGQARKRYRRIAFLLRVQRVRRPGA